MTSPSWPSGHCPPTPRRAPPQEREALQAIVSEAVGGQDLSSWPLTATYVVDAQGDPRFLVLTVHGMVDDPTSREVLVTDLLTAFGQRLAGSGHRSGTGHHELAGVVAALRGAGRPPRGARQPGYWIDTEAAATLAAGRPRDGWTRRTGSRRPDQSCRSR